MSDSHHYIWFYDFHYIWGAAKVFASGANPYDFEKYQAAVQASNWPAIEAVPPFPQPPWSLLVYYPFGLVNFNLGLVLWVACLIIFAFACFKIITTQCNSSGEIPSGKLIFGLLLFPPCFSTILNAQVNFIVLLGALLLVQYWDSNRSRALLGLCLTLMKPHIFLPVYLWVFLRLIADKQLKLIAIPIFAFTIIVGLTEVISPGIWRDYLSILPSTGPMHTALPGASISQIMFAAFGITKTWVAMLPICMAYAGWVGFKRRLTVKDSMDIILPASVLCTPYIWAHTFLILALSYAQFLSSLFQNSERKFQFFVLLVTALGIIEFVQPWSFSWLLAWLPLLLFIFCIRKVYFSASKLS